MRAGPHTFFMLPRPSGGITLVSWLLFPLTHALLDAWELL